MFMDVLRSSNLRRGIAIALSLVLICAPTALSCPFCLAPPDTWAEVADRAHTVLLAELVDVQLDDAQTRAKSLLRIVRVLREHGAPPSVTMTLGGFQPSPSELSTDTSGHSPLALIANRSGIENTPGRRTPGELRPGQIITLDEFVTGNRGDLFMLTGTHRPISAAEPTTFADDTDVTIVESAPPADGPSTENQFTGTPAWTSPVFYFWELSSPLDEMTTRYLLNLPSNSTPAALRLPYYVQWLESSNPEIAADAWGEFARSEYSDVLAARHLFDREKLRSWIANPKMSPERLGLYGMMLGLCGQPEDAEFLREQIGDPKPAKEFRFGTEGIMGGYLLLAGEDGLKHLEETRLKPAGIEYTEHFAVMQAVQFIWSYESDVISKPRLAQSLHYLLDQPQVRDLAITNLARWQDWDVTPRLISLYDECEESDTTTRESILQFMIAMNRASGSQSIHPELLAEGQSLLDQANSTSPKLLRAAYRQFGPPRPGVPASDK